MFRPRRTRRLGLLIKVIFSVNLYAMLALISSTWSICAGISGGKQALVVAPAVVTMPLAILLGLSVGTR